jgi:hypothetical protein
MRYGVIVFNLKHGLPTPGGHVGPWRPIIKSVADPEENFSGGQIHEWGLLFGKFK